MHPPARGSLTGVESHSHAIGPAQVAIVAETGPEAIIKSVYGDSEEIILGTRIVHTALEIEAPRVGAQRYFLRRLVNIGAVQTELTVLAGHRDKRRRWGARGTTGRRGGLLDRCRWCGDGGRGGGRL